MADLTRQNELFGKIAIEKQWITPDKLERALVLQRCISNRATVVLPIGQVLHKMGFLTLDQVDQILALQLEAAASLPAATDAEGQKAGTGDHLSGSVDLILSPDKMRVTLVLAKETQTPPLALIKQMLVENGIASGIVSEDLLAAQLKNPPEPFIVACGTPPEAGRPPEVRYYFDTDPLRIGTLLEDGTMDWKNRGDIPQVAIGDLLAEKMGGTPGRAGINVLGQDVAPPRIKDPPLKAGKGAERSEDGRQIFAKIGGTPRLGPDERASVFAVLPIGTDIGIETGHIEFDGHIEVDGGISAGYSVKGKSLNTREIQNAEVEMSEDVVCFGGVYSSTIKAGGHFKVSHLHNSTVEVFGDLIVEKEIFNCTVEVNGRCVIDGGKIIASKIAAKKGIQVKDIGTRAARPSELKVGVDFKCEREMKSSLEEIADLERRREEACEAIIALNAQRTQLETELGRLAQEQDGCMVQKRRLENNLKDSPLVDHPVKQALLEKLIAELSATYENLDQRIQGIMTRDDEILSRLDQHKGDIVSFDEGMIEVSGKMEILEEAAKVDPGVPIVKVAGTVFPNTLIIGPHRKILIPDEMRNIRIAESQEDGKTYQMRISSLR